MEKGLDSPEAKEKASSTSTGGGSRKKKGSRKLEAGRIYIKSSYNNTVITVTDDKGDVVAWSTAGSMGFAGPKKATPFAASKVVSAIVEKVEKMGLKKVDIYVSGIGPGRDSAIRSLAAQGFDIISIRDITSVAHNGPKARKERRT
ncbi:30S ribosomal protein S11 [Patescibacteria group bacterium]|nr:30S ribosomal protein S11 [Patescibacteria group bacterium]